MFVGSDGEFSTGLVTYSKGSFVSHSVLQVVQREETNRSQSHIQIPFQPLLTAHITKEQAIKKLVNNICRE